MPEEQTGGIDQSEIDFLLTAMSAPKETRPSRKVVRPLTSDEAGAGRANSRILREFTPPAPVDWNTLKKMQCERCLVGVQFLYENVNIWICKRCGYSNTFGRSLSPKEQAVLLQKESPLVDDRGNCVRFPLYYLESMQYSSLNDREIQIFKDTDWYQIADNDTPVILVSLHQSFIQLQEATLLREELAELKRELDYASDLTEFGLLERILEAWKLRWISPEQRQFSRYDGFCVGAKITPSEEEAIDETPIKSELISTTGFAPDTTAEVENLFEILLGNK
jgi:ribosomal protein S27AE